MQTDIFKSIRISVCWSVFASVFGPITTTELEDRLQKALCKSNFDISDQAVQECIQEIGIAVFLRIFAMKDRELV